MPIVVACQCGARFAAKDELAGQTLGCPSCGRALSIPKPAAATAPDVSSVSGILDEFGAKASATGYRCPKCRHDVQAGTAVCMHCGFNLSHGRDTSVQSDSLTEQRRQAMLDARYRATSGTGTRANEPTPTGVQLHSLGGMTEGTTAVTVRPWPAFSNLSHEGGTVEAFEFAFMGPFIMGIFWLTLYTLFFFTSPLVAMAQDPATAARFNELFNNVLLPAYAKGVMAFAAIYAFTIFMIVAVEGPIMAGIAHLILKYIGNSNLSYWATLRVYTYCIGATLVLSSIPPFTFIAPLTWIISIVVGLTAHHRVAPGVALLAWFLGSMMAFVVFLMFNLFASGLIGIAVLLLNPPTQF